MPGEEGGLVDDAVTDLPACKNRSRMLATSARVEIVTVEVEQHDARPFDPLEQRIEAGRVLKPRNIKISGNAQSPRPVLPHSAHLPGGNGSHSMEEASKRIVAQANRTETF